MCEFFSGVPGVWGFCRRRIARDRRTLRCRMKLCSRFRFSVEKAYLSLIADVAELIAPRTLPLGLEETLECERRIRPSEAGGNLPFLSVVIASCMTLDHFHNTRCHLNKKVGEPARWHSRSLRAKEECALSSIFLCRHQRLSLFASSAGE